ncbi:MAG: COG1361 S-layer family protein, partial [Anaerolineae bacterium]
MNTRLNVAAMVAALVAFARLGTAEAWLEPPRLALRHALQQQGEPLPTLILRAPTSRSGPDPQQASATPTSDDLPTSTPTSPATAAPSATPAATSRPSSTVVVTGTPTTGAATPTVTWVPPATLPQPIDTPEPTTAVGRPILVVSDSDVRPGAPAPGDDFVVRLEVQNVGRVDAENVLLTLSSDVLVPAGQGASMYKEEIDAGETRPFEARMRVDSSAQTGVYSLAIVLRWDDANGLSYSDQTAIGVHVQGTDESRPLITVNSAQAPSRCVPGAPFSVSFELANIGGWEARNVVLAPAAGTLALEGAGPPPVNIGPGGAATVSLRLVASPVAEPGAVQQVFEIRYDDPDNQRYGDTYQLGITVGNTAAFGPLPIITRYSFGDELHPGQVFQLEIEVLNAGVSDALRTRLALGGTASSTSVADGTSSGSALGVFAPLGSGNVQYLGRLAAGETTTVQQEMV